MVHLLGFVGSAPLIEKIAERSEAAAIGAASDGRVKSKAY
jgi:hypothetical protein